MIFIGLDPGVGGGISALHVTRRLANVDEFEVSSVQNLKLEGATEADVCEWLFDRHAYNQRIIWAVLEKVSSSPQMGVTSAFTFGRSYGFLRGCLSSLKIPFVEVTPQKWQKPFGIGKSDSQPEHKRKLKAKAQQLYPNEKVTLWNADALLLATYCRQNVSNLF